MIYKKGQAYLPFSKVCPDSRRGVSRLEEGLREVLYARSSSRIVIQNLL